VRGRDNGASTAVAMVVRYSDTLLPTVHGSLRCVVYRDDVLATEHVAMVAGDPRGQDVLVRVHSECLTSEVLGSLKCDCKAQLDAALERIHKTGRGVVIYMRGHEGRGIGLGNKIRAYALQEQGHDTVDANRMLGLPDDERDFSAVRFILDDLGVTSVRLLTNNPLKVKALEGMGIVVAQRVPHLVAASPAAKRYLETKGERMGHVYVATETARPAEPVRHLRVTV
jgi:GTP cyclohydrolase II